MKLNTIIKGSLFLFMVSCQGSRVSAQIIDAAADFSLSGNPNGVWSYGTKGTTLTGPFTVFSNSSMAFGGNSNIHAWTGTQAAFGYLYPFVAKNIAATSQDGGGGFVPLLPGQLCMSPSSTGNYIVARFTAATAGDYFLDATFQGRDVRGTTTDVHILQNGVAFYDGVVNGFDTASNQTYFGLQSLLAGDQVDFAVGNGPNFTFNADSTALAAIFNASPGTGVHGDSVDVGRALRIRPGLATPKVGAVVHIYRRIGHDAGTGTATHLIPMLFGDFLGR